ncbi:MAG: hypothetical protein WC876_01995 [Candidatus Thermoplasmatota archaeon]|jgi:hypothetical protein
MRALPEVSSDLDDSRRTLAALALTIADRMRTGRSVEVMRADLFAAQDRHERLGREMDSLCADVLLPRLPRLVLVAVDESDDARNTGADSL